MIRLPDLDRETVVRTEIERTLSFDSTVSRVSSDLLIAMKC